MRPPSQHKIRGKVKRLARSKGREVTVEHRVGNHLRLRVVMGDVVWSTELRGFDADDPRIPPLRAALEAATQTAQCDAAANEAVGRLGRGAQCFAARRTAGRHRVGVPELPAEVDEPDGESGVRVP
jgi:hypothetical protein